MDIGQPVTLSCGVSLFPKEGTVNSQQDQRGNTLKPGDSRSFVKLKKFEEAISNSLFATIKALPLQQGKASTYLVNIHKYQ